MGKRFGFFFTFLFITFYSNAQETHLSIIILSAGDSMSVPFANGYLKGTQFSWLSDEKGNIHITLKKSTGQENLIVNAFGYEEASVPIGSIKKETPFRVFLNKKAYTLPAVNINGRNAKGLMLEVIKHLPENFKKESDLTPAYYRQVHKENGQYVRLIEAGIIFDNGNYFPDDRKREKVAVLTVRRSNNYEKNKEQHGDHLMDLLEENPVRYNEHSVLNKKAIDWYRFNFIEDKNNNGLTVIRFHSLDKSKEKIETGKLFIDEGNFMIKAIEVETYPNPYKTMYARNSTKEPFFWDFLYGKYVIKFENDHGVLKTMEMHKTYVHNLYDTPANSLTYVVEENFDLFSEQEKKSAVDSTGLSEFSNLYSAEFVYNENEWKNIPLLDGEIQKDLEKVKSLSIQFRQNSLNKREP